MSTNDNIKNKLTCLHHPQTVMTEVDARKYSITDLEHKCSNLKSSKNKNSN